MLVIFNAAESDKRRKRETTVDRMEMWKYLRNERILFSQKNGEMRIS